jgi:hypothetical protein
MSYCKKPCKHCPFRNDVKPFLHPDRAYEIASAALNPYNSFACHKTTVNDEEFGGEGDKMVATNESLECAGFLTLRAGETDRGLPKGFEPSFDIIYESVWDMTDAYEEEWNKTHKTV